METKKCSRCSTIKSIDNFDYSNKIFGEKQIKCMKCTNKDANQKLSCPECTEIFPTSNYIDWHYFSVHGERKYPCRKGCKHISHTSSHRSIHEKNVHTTELKVTCSECGSVLADKRSLARHMTAKHKSYNERPYSCDDCDKKFTTSQQLNTHRTTIHEKIPKFPCDLCDHITSSSEEFLRIHKEYAHYGRIDRCDVEGCTYSANVRYALQSHKKIHGDRLYECNICDYVAVQQKYLTIHIKHHSKDTPYKCSSDDCFCSFKTKAYLAKHMKIHDPKLYFICKEEKCLFRHKEKEFFDLHTRIHQKMDEEKAKCTRCNLNLALSFFGTKYHRDEQCIRCIDCNKRDKKTMCECGKEKFRCKEHGSGTLFCEHGIEKYSCKPCDGSSKCSHGKLKSVCVDCDGGSICACGIARNRCKIHDPLNHLISLVRRRIRHALKNKTKSSIEYLGCDADEYVLYLEDKFRDGMTWGNQGNVWHIDHIKPIFFKENDQRPDEEEISKRLHYTNTQPLLVAENMEKGNRWIG